MDRTLKRLFSILLCICITLGMPGAAACAQGMAEPAAAFGETESNQTVADGEQAVPDETSGSTEKTGSVDVPASAEETLAAGAVSAPEETSAAGKTDPEEAAAPTEDAGSSEQTDFTGETSPSAETDPSEQTDPAAGSANPTDSTEATYPWNDMTDEEFAEFMMTEGYLPYEEDAEALESLSARVERVVDEQLRLSLDAILEAFINREESQSAGLMAASYSASAGTVTLEELNSSEMFFKQTTGGTCTLAANAMMVRRAARLNGNSNWASVTESSLRDIAWVDGVGMGWNYSYAGITVTHTDVSSSTMEQFLAFLKQHPEGFVAYNKNKPHAVLITDYDEKTGTIYCADPGLSDQRMPLEQSVLKTGDQSSTVKGFTAYWYVSSPKLTLASSSPTLEDREVVVSAAVNEDNSVSLSWTNTEASGYRVYRSDDPDGPWDSPIYDAVGASNVTWTDTTTVAFQTYYYRVESYNAEGKTCYQSEVVSCTPSNMVAELYGNSLTLNGDIGMNFYVFLPAPLAADSDAYVILNDSRIPVSSATVSTVDGKTLYKFSCNVASPYMGVQISFRLYDGSGQPVKLLKNGQDITDSCSYSIADYCSAASETSNSGLASLTQAMINYGHYSQLHFGTGVPVAAPDGFSMDAASLSALSAYEPQVTGAVPGLSYLGSSVVLESQTTIKHYFTLEEGSSASDYTVTVDGVAVQMEVSDRTCVVRVPNVTASKLGIAYKIVVQRDDSAIEINNYSAFSYAYAAVSNNSDETLTNTACALYCYGIAAKNYFGV